MHITENQIANFKAKLVPQPSGCIEWAGSRNNQGYGNIKVGLTETGTRKNQLTHRVSFFLEHGYLPPLLRHTCDNPPCCNHDHLVEGTVKQNSADLKERHPERLGLLKGEDNNLAKLTEKQVREIRAELALGTRGLVIADAFGVCQATISMIKTGKIWRHVL